VKNSLKSPHDPRTAARGRDLGLRRIGRLSWRAGLAGVVSCVLLAVAFGHHTSASAQAPTAIHDHGSGGIVIPAQPPAPATGGGQVTSGAS
jgi:hypothetical protein